MKLLPGVDISTKGGPDNVSQVRHVVDIRQGRGDQHVALTGDRHPRKRNGDEKIIESTAS